MTEPEKATIPVGGHTLPLDEHQAGQVRALIERGAAVEIIGLRVWIERRDGGLFLHVGELQVVPVPRQICAPMAS